MAQFGYDAAPVAAPPLSRLRFTVDTVPLENARLRAWRVREAVRDVRGRPVPAYRLVDGAHR